MELTLDQALQKGIEAHKAGKAQEADQYYTAIIKADPKHPDANHNMGVLVVGVGKLQEALPFFKTALETNSSITQYWLSYIDALIKLERMDDAKAVLDQAKSNGADGEVFDEMEKRLNPTAFNGSKNEEPPGDQLQSLINLYTQGHYQEALNKGSQLLKQFPNSFNLHNIMGATNQGQGKLDEAIEAYTKALAIKPDYADTHYNIGVTLQGQGKLEEAIEAYTKALAIKPDYTEAYNNMGNALKGQGKLDEAIEAYTKALAIKPDYAEAHYNMGATLQQQGKLDEAVEAYTKALSIKPDYAEAYNNMGNALKGQGKLDEAIEAYTKALAIKPDYAEAHYNMGATLQQQGKLDEAVEAYTKALSIKPDYAEAYNNMGNALKGQGKLDEAIEAYTKALAIKPDYTEAYNNMGNALQQQGTLDEAIEAYKKALSIKPDYTEAYNNMGIVLKGQGKLDEAIEAYTKALAIKPDYADTHYNMGATLQQQGKLDEAVEAYTKALASKPDYTEAYNNMGNALQEQGKLDEAVEAYTKALAIKPDYTEAYNNMGNAVKGQGKLDEAIEAYTKALAIKPDYTEAHYNRGATLQDQGKLDEAVEAYKKALSIKPDYAEAYNNMGNALKDQGKLDEAIEAYKKAICIKPDYAEAYNNMGNALKDQGKLEEVVEAYKKALSIKPDYADAYNNMGNALENLGRMDESVSNFQKAFAFRSGIVPKGDKAIAPATTGLFFELTNKCNFHCVFCPSDSQKRNLGSMNLELVKRLYTEASEKRLASVVNLHLMGEPTLHPQLIEILDFGASKNIKTDLVTNGSTLVAKIVPKILDSLYGTITASHMTPTKETYHFRGTVGLSWERYISNLRLLIREYMKRIAKGTKCKNDITIRVMSTMNTSANCTITENTEEARAILKEWTDFVASVEEELGMDRFERVDYNSRDLLQENRSRSIDYPLQKGMKLTFWRAFTFANTRVSDEYELEDKGETAYCPHPFRDVGVLWNGDVTLCCLDHDGELSVGNINNSSIEEIIQNDAAKKLRASMLGRCSLPSVCKTCQAKPVKRQNADKVSPAIA